MASLSMKVSILQKAMRPFVSWLDSCEQLVLDLPRELETQDFNHLRELALKYKDLLLQMKERCTYIQEVNNLCKEVEQEASSPGFSMADEVRTSSALGSIMTKIPELTEEEELADLEGREVEFKPSSRKSSTASNSSNDMDPKLVHLAMEVKDLNTRFANTCMQAKDHYAALSRALTVSIERQSTVDPATTMVTTRRKKSSKGSSGGSPKKNRRSLSHIEDRHKDEFKKVSNRRSCIEVGFASPIKDSSNASPNKLEATDNSGGGPGIGQGVDFIPKDSVVLAGLTQTTAKAQQSSSLSTGAGLNGELKHSPGSAATEVIGGDSSSSNNSSSNSSPSKVVLRRKPADPDDYSDTKPRQKKRPKSALIIEANPASGTAVLSEVQLQDGNSQRPSSIVRRRSIEVDYTALARTGLLPTSKGSPLCSTPNSPYLSSKSNKRASRRLGIQPRDRSSIASIESLDPRAIMMLGGDMEQSAEYHNRSFEASTASDITCSTSQVPDYVLEQRIGMWKGIVENGLSKNKRSMSFDVLVPKEKQAVTLRSRLSELSSQIQEFVHRIAENRQCALQSLDLQLHLGQLKAISSLMEFQDLELTRYSAVYSPASQEKLEGKKKTKRLSMTDQDPAFEFPNSEIDSCREEIEKLMRRVELLKKHCEDAIQQTEEVLEFVSELESQLKFFKDSLVDHISTVVEIKKSSSQGYSEDSWMKLSQAFTDMTEQKTQFQSITDLSNQLLQLEPIFNGSSIRGELLNVKKRFQKVVLELFIQLEGQAKSWTEQLLLEMTVLGSWITEAELSMQALNKKSKKPNGVTSKLLETRTNLLKEVKDKLSDLEETSNKLQSVSLVLKPDSHKPLGELLKLVDKHLEALQLVRVGLEKIPASSSPGSGGQEKPLLGATNRGYDLEASLPLSSDEKRGEPQGMQNPMEEEDNDGINPYAELNNLRKQIFQDRSVNVSGLPVPPGPGDSRGRVTSVSGMRFSLPGLKVDAGETSDLYERVEEVIPSPFVDQDMASTHLDSAIETISNRRSQRLSMNLDPHSIYNTPTRTKSHSPAHSTPNRSSGYAILPLNSSPVHADQSHYAVPPSHLMPAKPKRIHYTEIDVSIYDNPKLKNTSCNTVTEGEWPGRSPERSRRERKKKKKKSKKLLHEELLIFVSKEWKDLEMDVLEQQALDASMEGLRDSKLQSTCREMVGSMRETESRLKMCEDKLLVLRSPQLPDLERVHATIDQCQKLRETIGGVYARVEEHSAQSLEVTCQLRERIPSEQKTAQLMELLLFDVSMLWHVVNMHCASRMSYLRENESSINYLHRELQAFTRLLSEAKTVVQETPYLLDVEEHLKKADIVHSNLKEHVERKAKLAADLKERVSVDLQAPVSQELTSQLQQVECDWEEVDGELGGVAGVQPVLVVRVVGNGSKEAIALRNCLDSLSEERALDRDQANANKLKCQECVLKAQQLELSMTYTEKTLQSYIAKPPEWPKQSESGAGKILKLLAETDNKERSQDGGEGEGAGLPAPDYQEVLDQCLSVSKEAGRLLLELDEAFSTLAGDTELLTKFQKAWEDIGVWVSDTKSMLEVSTATSSPRHASRMGGAAPHSSALLRGKQQAICQQVVARKPKMETLHSLVVEMMLIPASSKDKQKLEAKMAELCSDWDDLCQQCVPAGVLPMVTTPTGVGGTLGFQHPGEFEDISQMLEWLIHVESRLHSVKLTVGDFARLKKALRDSLRIEKELKLRDKDYKKFTDGMDPEVSSMVDSELENSLEAGETLARPIAVSFSPTKTVKFNDENTLERELRQQEIMKNFKADNTDSSLESSILDSDSLPMPVSIPYHATGPMSGEGSGSGGKQTPNDHGLEPNLNSPVTQSRILTRMSSDPECPLSRLLKSANTTPMTPISEEHYHLMLLWKGIWAVLLQQRNRLETIKERWKMFEGRKEEFSRFLFRAEERMATFFRVIGTTKNLGVIQTEMVAQKVFDSELVVNEQHLSVLNTLSEELIHDFHQEDDTADLKDTMKDLNQRWSKMKESCTLQQPTMSALLSRWTEFYQDYQSFEKVSQRLDMDMSNMNPFISDMDAVKTQLDKLKSVQQELQAKDSTLEKMRVLVVSLLQGPGGAHLNAEGIHVKMENLTKRWKHLHSLATERKSALEQALSEKQDFLSLLADCLAWLNKAEKHLKKQKPMETDARGVANQLRVHEEFLAEVKDQQKRMGTVITSGRHMMMERHWPKETAEGLKAGCSGVENRWKWVCSEAEEWGKLLETVLPEMEKFQALCADCGKKLSDAEILVDKLDSVSRKVPVLKKQQDTLQVFERSMVEVGENLGVLVNSQKKQLELGVRKSMDLVQMVKKFHQRWNAIRDRIEKRKKDIKDAMIKYDPANLGVAALPKGWARKSTDNNVPYFLHTGYHGEPQWSHPDLYPLYVKVRCDHNLPAYPSGAYPVALRLRQVQKRTQLSLLHTREAMEAYEDHAYQFSQGHPPSHTLSPYDSMCLAVDMYQRLEEVLGMEDSAFSPAHSSSVKTASSGKDHQQFYINSAVDLTTSWIRDLYDHDHKGAIPCSSFMLAIISMSSGKLDEKYRALFRVVSGDRNSIDLEQLTNFLEQITQIPQLVCDDQFCSLHALDICARECFKKFVGVGRLQLPGFISWLQSEPLPLSWLPVLHRLAAAECSIHDVKCGLCKTTPLSGFRYRCIQCNNLDMCQMCYWSGKSVKGHDKNKHYMEEYCVASKHADEVKDFFKSFQKSFRRKKKETPQQRVRKESLAPTQVGGFGISPPFSSMANSSSKSKTWSANRRSPPPARTNGVKGEEHHPGRRFTVTEDLRSAWTKGGLGGVSGAAAAATAAAKGGSANYRKSFQIGSTPDKHKLSNGRKVSASSMIINEAGHYPRLTGEDMETSINKLKETTLSLSRHIMQMKEHHQRPITNHTSGHSHTDGSSDADSNELALKLRNNALQGRVEILQQHNRRLEGCITQLRLIADVHQQHQVHGAATSSLLSPPITHTSTSALATSSRISPFISPVTSAKATPTTSVHNTPIHSSRPTSTFSPSHGQYTVTPNSAHQSPNVSPSHGKYTVNREAPDENPYFESRNVSDQHKIGTSAEVSPTHHLTPASQASTVIHPYSHLTMKTSPVTSSSGALLIGSLSPPNQVASPRYSGISQGSSNGSITLAASTPSQRTSRIVPRVPPPQIVLNHQQEKGGSHVERTLL